MSYTDKLNSALALIQSHNDAVEDKSDRIDSTLFQKKLKSLGGTTEEALQESSYEDIECAGIPKILARKIAKVFRTENNTDAEYVSPKKASSMSGLQLIQQYNHNESNNSIAKELKDRTNNKKFIIFNVDGTVNIDKTKKLFDEIIAKWPEREYLEVNNESVRVYRVGEGKLELADESPIYAGRPLRPDGTDDQLGRSWDGVSIQVRQLIYVAVTKTKEIIPSNKEAHDILDMALLPDGYQKIQQRCRNASVVLRELIEQDNIPKLKINRTSAKNTSSNDPFFQNHKTY